MTDIEFTDDNQRILDTIKERMIVGQERYGHGMRIQDDTTQYGTLSLIHI